MLGPYLKNNVIYINIRRKDSLKHKYIKHFAQGAEVERPLGRRRHRWENSIKVELRRNNM
jgi:hypothetical protein